MNNIKNLEGFNQVPEFTTQTHYKIQLFPNVENNEFSEKPIQYTKNKNSKDMSTQT